MQVAIGRAQVLLGEARQALAALDEGAARWELAPAHGRAARWRWRAEALSELGQESAAEALRGRLMEEDAGEEASAVVLLARLDRVARQGRHDAMMGELEAHPWLGRELTRLVARFQPTLNVETTALLRRHSRY